MAAKSKHSGNVVTLIDASGYIFRAYHALPHLSTSKGVSTHAVLGFTRMLLKLIREFEPTYLALAFDKDSRQGRLAIDPSYKANREGPPDDLVPQFPLVRKVVEVLNVPALEVAGWEADDVIGTLAKQAVAQGFEVMIVSSDKDFIQIVDDKVRLYDPWKERSLGPAEVEEDLGIKPAQMQDYLALIGDAIDNIPKVPGIGPKTAVELIQQFGNVETLITRVEEVKKPKIKEAIKENVDQLRRAKQLVGFKLDLPLSKTVQELARQPIHDARTRELFGELEFYKILQELPPPPVTPLLVETQILTELAGLQTLAQEIATSKDVTIVPAYEGLPFAAELVGLAFALPLGRTFYVPLLHHYLGVSRQPSAAMLREILGPVLEDASVKKSGHSLKTLLLLLGKLGIRVAGAEGDVELLSYLLNPSRREHALTDLCRERLLVELPPSPTAAVVRKKGPALTEVPVEQAATAFGCAADGARRLLPLVREDIENAGLGKLAREIELPLVQILADMERKGVKVDPKALSAIGIQVDAEAEVYLQRIYKAAGHEFNVGSNTQLADVLYTELKLPILKRGKTGPSTDQEVLDKLAQQHPLPAAITEYRGLSKLKSTYLETLPTLIASDGRLHTTLHQVATATGRLSSSDPNLQNIPIRTELGREIRKAFVAEPGNQLISADYSQIELRILAHITGDPALVDAFMHDADVHTRTAAEVFGVPPAEVTAEMRRRAKAVNFGIAYGLSPYGLSTRLDIPKEEAKSIIDRYFERYSGIRAYLENTVEKARETGYVETLYGRRRWMPDLKSKNWQARSSAERAAINMPIQGTAADLIKLAMIELHARFRTQKLQTQMLLQVHDELLFEAPEAEVATVMELARTCMSGVATLRVPLKVEVRSGHSWAEAH
ncbi:MAG: DNA polymerase I [Myxococcaceae bacterium]